VVSYGCFKGLIRFSYFFQRLAIATQRSHRSACTEALAGQGWRIEAEVDQNQTLLSVTSITPIGRVEIEYSSGKMTFPSEPALTPLIFNFIIR
jgi:hypothetical protein